MAYYGSIFDDFPQLKPFVRCYCFIIAFFGALVIFHDGCEGKQEFIPFSGIAKTSYTENSKRGGIYYQKIILRGNRKLSANGFSIELNGEKIWLIDYVQKGDSIVYKTTKTILVYRVGNEPYVFTYNRDDFK